MNLKLSRLLPFTLIAVCLLPASALASPQVDPETNDGRSFYATVGSKISINQALVDESICADNRYNPDTDEDVDVNGDDYGMAGVVATLQSQPQSGGEWSNVSSMTISRDDLDVECYDEGEGAAFAEIDLSGQAGDVRTNYRIIYRGGAVNANVDSKPNLMFPRFPEKWQWKTNKSVTSTQLKLTTDPKLIGTRVTVFVSAGPKYKTFKLAKSAVIRKKGSKGSVQIKTKLPAKSKKRGWRSYGCVNYQANYPLMNTGNSCPTKTVAAAQLEELFPYSTLGPL